MPKSLNEAFFETYPNLKECTIQTFNDDAKEHKQENVKKIPYSTLSSMDFLNELNGRGAGIFFSVNPMET
jgi:hypothetical protein